MSEEFAKVVSYVDAFLAGGDFWALWGPLCGPDINTIDDTHFSAAEAAAHFELSELVYMGSAGRVSAGERALGLRGEAELRVRLKDWRRLDSLRSA